MSNARPIRVAAAIDVGSNSVHLLVARALRGVRAGSHTTLSVLDDRSDLVGLGDVVDEHGSIPPGSLEQVIGSLSAFIALAAGLGAGTVVVVGTEPFRRAANAEEARTAIERAVGVALEVLSEREEAELTFLGVTGGRPPAETLAVADIGGGSTEVGIHVPGRSLEVVPLAVGSARLTNSIVRNDPPSRAELADLAAAARQVVAEAKWPDLTGVAVRRATFVGGTATNVARLGRLNRSHLQADMDTLATIRADEVVERFAVRPRRARQLAAGVAIINALLDRFGLARAGVSEASLRDGAILAALLNGRDWLTGLDDQIG